MHVRACVCLCVCVCLYVRVCVCLCMCVCKCVHVNRCMIVHKQINDHFGRVCPDEGKEKGDIAIPALVHVSSV